MEDSRDVSELSTAKIQSLDHRKAFPQFVELHDDIRRHIVSFVADAPLEQDLPGPLFVNRCRPATMTASLPLVCKEFHELSNLEQFWEAALIRQLSKKRVWIDGLQRLLPEESTSSNNNGNEGNEWKKMINSVRRLVGTQIPCKEMYQKILNRHIRFIAPLFIMPFPLSLGECYGLHLFEPRYRLMIHDLMQSCANTEEASNGGKIRPGRENGMLNPPVLIHACRGNRLWVGDMACLVQVVWCQVYEHGTADVRLLPISWVRLEQIWVRPSSSLLYYARATRV